MFSNYTLKWEEAPWNDGMRLDFEFGFCHLQVLRASHLFSGKPFVKGIGDIFSTFLYLNMAL